MNSRFRPYRIILSRQGGSINIIQVTVYFFTVPALKLMNVKFCLFLATTAHCHDRAAIKIHITTFNRINLHVRCRNLHNLNCFWLSTFGPWQGPSASFYFMTVFFCFFCCCQGLYIGTLKCRGSIIVYIHMTDNFHPFCNPYIEISIKGEAFWDHRFFRS